MSAFGSEPSDDDMRTLETMVYDAMLEKSVVPPTRLGIPLKQIFPDDWNTHFERAWV